MRELSLHPLAGTEEIRPGSDLGAQIVTALRNSQLGLRASDVLVVAQKVVSKAEGRFRDLLAAEASDRARELATITGKDTRLVELVLRESTEVIRAVKDVLIVRHRLGLVLAQAGVDRSNVPDEQTVLLLPEDPDASAERLRAQLAEVFGLPCGPGVVISDR